MSERRGVLFVCLGNICRSPLAEGIFLDRLDRRGLRDAFLVDSAGTGHWHVGEPPDRRARRVAERHGITLPSIGRQVDPATDFDRFHWLIAMDRSNQHSLLELGAPRQRVHIMGSFDPATDPDKIALDVPDPYFGGPDGFDVVFEMLSRACEGLLDRIGGHERG